jgi:Icc-related predicted phosphoesterase
MGLISLQERKQRILNTSHVILVGDSTVHQVDSVEQIGNIIFVNVGSGLLFQDLDIFTLEEACIAEKIILNIKKELDIK